MQEASTIFTTAATTMIKSDNKGSVVISTRNALYFRNASGDQEMLEDRRAEALLLQAPFL